jgi:hypothetical protein
LYEELDLKLHDYRGNGRLTFGEGEERLSRWMRDNTTVSWIADPEPWLVEEAFLREVPLALNLDHNARGAFYPELKSAREALRMRA